MPIAFSIHLFKNKKFGGSLRSNQSIERMIKTPETNSQMSFIKKAGKWAPLIGGTWIILNIVVPLALLRLPFVQKYIVVLEDKLPFDLPGFS